MEAVEEWSAAEAGGLLEVVPCDGVPERFQVGRDDAGVEADEVPVGEEGSGFKCATDLMQLDREVVPGVAGVEVGPEQPHEPVAGAAFCSGRAQTGEEGERARLREALASGARGGVDAWRPEKPE